MIISQVDTPRLIPCSAMNSLNTFPNKSLQNVLGRNRTLEKLCLRCKSVFPVPAWTCSAQGQPLVSVGNPKSGRQKVDREVCVWSMNCACHHPNMLLSCFVSLFPSVSLDVSPAPHLCWDGNVLSWLGLCSLSLLLHPAGASLPCASVLFPPLSLTVAN